MTYCRIGDDSNVYVLKYLDSTLVCMIQTKTDTFDHHMAGEQFKTDSPIVMLNLLTLMKFDKYLVPERALERLRNECAPYAKNRDDNIQRAIDKIRGNTKK